MKKLATSIAQTLGGSALFLGVIWISGCSAPEEITTVPELVGTEETDPAVKLPASSFVSADFLVPQLAESDDFKLVPLGPDLVKIDYEAYMSSIEHLQKTFSRSESWPNEGIDDAAALLDMQNEQRRFNQRESFAYGVLTPDGEREFGSVYVRPSKKPGFDAQVSMWVTQADFDAGFDATLYSWVQNWVASSWPFTNVAYPGRAIDWKDWDALPDRVSTYSSDPALQAQNLATAEKFIDAFYSFDPKRLRPIVAKAKATADSILYYQGWAEGGNYEVLERAACVAESTELFRCAITVKDDPVVELQTGFNVTDTFAITFDGTDIVAINTSSNDQPIYYEARKWVEANMPEVMSGPCAGRGKPDYAGQATAGDCARAMTEGYREFYAATRGGSVGS